LEPVRNSQGLAAGRKWVHQRLANQPSALHKWRMNLIAKVERHAQNFGNLQQTAFQRIPNQSAQPMLRCLTQHDPSASGLLSKSYDCFSFYPQFNVQAVGNTREVKKALPRCKLTLRILAYHGLDQGVAKVHSNMSVIPGLNGKKQYSNPAGISHAPQMLMQGIWI